MTKTKKLHVLMILISNSIGGAEKRYANLFNYLAQNGSNEYSLLINRTLYSLLKGAGFQFYNKNKVILVGKDLINRKNRENNKISWEFITYLWMRVIHSINWRLNKLYIKVKAPIIINRIKPDILHGILKGVNILCYKGSKNIARVASLVHTTGEIPEYQREALNEVEGLDILSINMKSKLIDESISTEDRMFVVPCSFTNYDKTYIKKKQKTVVFLGRMEPMKHPEIFVEMIKHIPKEIVGSAKFIMMGEGSMMGKIEEMAASLVEAGILELKHYVADPIEYLAESLIFVQPTDCEAHATQSLLEAMAMAKPIIASNISDLREILDGCGWIVEPEKPEQLAEKIQYVLNNPEEAEEMGNKARQKCIEKYSWDAMEEILLNVFKKYE